MSELTAARSYLDKAERSIRSAQALSALGDTEGACSRAYYAVFYAAQAALIVEGFGDEVSSIKTHSGLLEFFSR